MDTPIILLCSLSAKGDIVLPELRVFSDCDLGRERGELKLFGFTTSEKKDFKSPVVGIEKQ